MIPVPVAVPCRHLESRNSESGSPRSDRVWQMPPITTSWLRPSPPSLLATGILAWQLQLEGQKLKGIADARGAGHCFDWNPLARVVVAFS